MVQENLTKGTPLLKVDALYKKFPNISTLGFMNWQKWPYRFFIKKKKVLIFWGSFPHPPYKNKFERVMWQPCDWLDNWGLVIGWMTKGAITSKKSFYFGPSNHLHFLSSFSTLFGQYSFFASQTELITKVNINILTSGVINIWFCKVFFSWPNICTFKPLYTVIVFRSVY